MMMRLKMNRSLTPRQFFRKSRLPCSAAFFLALAACGLAQTNGGPAQRLSLQECFDLALSNNLSLKFERINPLLAEETLTMDRANYYDPTFTFSGSYTHDEPDTRSDNFSTSILKGHGPNGLSYGFTAGTAETDVPGTSSGNWGATIAQPFLRNFLIDQGRWSIASDKNEIKQSRQQLQLQIMTILNQVEQAYYDLIFARDNVKVQQSGLDLAQRLFEDNQKKVQIGVMAPLEEKQAESQVAARQTDLSTALRTLVTAQNTLKKLITGEYRNLHESQLEPTVNLITLPIDINLQESWKRALSQRPDLIKARLELERRGITLKYAKNQVLPQLDLIASYGYGSVNQRAFNDTFDELIRGDRPTYTVGGVFSIPIGNRAAQSNYRQSKLNVDQALLSLKGAEEDTLVRVDEVVNQVKTSWLQVSSTRAASLYAKEAMEAEQKKYALGKSTSFVVLQLQRDYIAAQSDEIRAKSEYNKAQAQLAFEEGNTLKRDGIRLEIK